MDHYDFSYKILQQRASNLIELGDIVGSLRLKLLINYNSELFYIFYSTVVSLKLNNIFVFPLLASKVDSETLVIIVSSLNN